MKVRTTALAGKTAAISKPIDEKKTMALQSLRARWGDMHPAYDDHLLTEVFPQDTLLSEFVALVLSEKNKLHVSTAYLICRNLLDDGQDRSNIIFYLTATMFSLGRLFKEPVPVINTLLANKACWSMRSTIIKLLQLFDNHFLNFSHWAYLTQMKKANEISILISLVMTNPFRLANLNERWLIMENAHRALGSFEQLQGLNSTNVQFLHYHYQRLQNLFTFRSAWENIDKIRLLMSYKLFSSPEDFEEELVKLAKAKKLRPILTATCTPSPHFTTKQQQYDYCKRLSNHINCKHLPFLVRLPSPYFNYFNNDTQRHLRFFLLLAALPEVAVQNIFLHSDSLELREYLENLAKRSQPVPKDVLAVFLAWPKLDKDLGLIKKIPWSEMNLNLAKALVASALPSQRLKNYLDIQKNTSIAVLEFIFSCPLVQNAQTDITAIIDFLRLEPNLTKNQKKLFTVNNADNHQYLTQLFSQDGKICQQKGYASYQTQLSWPKPLLALLQQFAITRKGAVGNDIIAALNKNYFISAFAAGKLDLTYITACNKAELQALARSQPEPEKIWQPDFFSPNSRNKTSAHNSKDSSLVFGQ